MAAINITLQIMERIVEIVVDLMGISRFSPFADRLDAQFKTDFLSLL